MTQNEMIFSWLQKSPIGPLEAMKELGVMRLAARIKDLRDDGHEIDMSWNYVIDRNGEERRVARYTLKGINHDVTPKNKKEKRQGGAGEEKPSPSKLGSWFRLFGVRID